MKSLFDFFPEKQSIMSMLNTLSSYNPMVNTKLLSAYPVQVPREMRGDYGGVHVTLETGRHIITLPIPANTYNVNQGQRIIRINLPRSGLHDLSTMLIRMDAFTTVLPPATWAAFPNLFSSVITRVTLFQDTHNRDEERNYGPRLAREMYYFKNRAHVYTNHEEEYGIGTLAQRQVWAGTVGPVPRTYWIWLRTGWAKRYMDFSRMKGQLYIEIELSPSTCLESDNAATVGYQVQNVQCQMDLLDAVNEAFKVMYQPGDNCSWTWQTEEMWDQLITAATTTDVEVPFTGESMQGVGIIQLADNYLNDVTQLDRYIRANYNNMTQLRLWVNGRFFPHDMIPCANANNQNDLWYFFKRFVNSFSSDSPGNDKELPINRNQFYLGNQNFALISLEQNHLPGDLNPVSPGPSGRFTCHIEWTAPTTTRLYFVIFHQKLFFIKDGEIQSHK